MFKNITESFHNYKGYIIRLRAATNSGFSYSIIKHKSNSSSPNGIKNIYLRTITYNFILADELLQKAKDYIDNYSNKLEEKYLKS